ncbi:MAG TPA: membrane dipeptidase [Rhodanobacter sp.]|nr:membrane dipeptidase [Rhodanobacter sp.]
MRDNETRNRPATATGAAPLVPELALVSSASHLTRMLAADAPAAALYRHALVLDANTLASIGLLASDADAKRKLQAVRDSGITAVKTTLGDANGSFEAAVADIAAAQTLIEQRPDLFLKVVRHADLQRARAERKVAVIFSFEAASMLEDKLERIDLFRQFDVLIMQLTYNHKTPFGCACLDGDRDGLTDLGRAAIARMNALGIALDLSHANVQTTVDSIAAATRPPVITHAGCRAVFDHPRNKRDAEMRALADKGGVMGIYMLPFLTPETRQPMLADYIQHLTHALDVCGEDHVGIGTDSVFFTATAADLEETRREVAARRQAGVNAPGENRLPYIPDIDTPRKLELVADALLQHGYSARVTEKVLGLNFSRVFGEIWTA